MKKFIAMLTAGAALCMTAAFTIPAAAESGDLVVLGDSITSGYGLDGYTPGDNYSAQDSFANQLGASYSSYQNFAVDGRTSGELLEALDDQNIAEALSGADTVVVSIGGNDFLQPMISAAQSMIEDNSEMLESFQNGENIDADNYLDIMREFTETMTEAANSVDIGKTGDNIEEILDGISAVNPDCQMIILTVYNPFEGVEGMEIFDVTAREKLAELNGEITAAAEKYGAQTADVYASFKGHAVEYTNISSMDIHPNKSGHALIYSILAELTGNVPADDALLHIPAKGSPDTGVGDDAVFAGIAALSAAAVFAMRSSRGRKD